MNPSPAAPPHSRVIGALADTLGALARARIRRAFYLERHRDTTGVSGAGQIALGYELEDGRAVMEWQTPERTVGIYTTLADLVMIHGHGGATRCYDTATGEELHPPKRTIPQ